MWQRQFEDKRTKNLFTRRKQGGPTRTALFYFILLKSTGNPPKPHYAQWIKQEKGHGNLGHCLGQRKKQTQQTQQLGA